MLKFNAQSYKRKCLCVEKHHVESLYVLLIWDGISSSIDSAPVCRVLFLVS